jgi:hypothetical protein
MACIALFIGLPDHLIQYESFLIFYEQERLFFHKMFEMGAEKIGNFFCSHLKHLGVIPFGCGGEPFGQLLKSWG